MRKFKSFAVATRLTTRATAIVALAFVPARAQSADCMAAYKPMSKLYDKPFHMYMVDSAQTDAALHRGQPTTSESIWTGSALYVMSRGKWMKSPIDIAELRKDKDPNTGKATCSHVRDEAVNGEAATVWRIHSVNEDAAMDSEEWVSKSRGVVLKSEIRQDVGGAFGKSHTVARYEYTNVRAPAGLP